MAEKTRHRKKNRRKQNEEHDRIKRMSMFGLRIETRDDYDENNYDDFKNVRREIKDKSHTYRIGPAPVTDYQIKPNHHVANTPGSLDSDLDSLDLDTHFSSDLLNLNASRAGCRGLIMYFAKLGNFEGDDNIDLEFVDSLLRGGADINFSDRHGQTPLHEISRSWHTDVAQFALLRGADLNNTDNFGRTPLHLASAINYPEMVFWLITNGARIEERTIGELQTAVHYAAKNNATDSLKVLLHMGGSINEVDYKNRTPLFVAAETGRAEACRFLLEQGAPCGVYDDCGTSALTLMVEKMPDVAKIALGQFEMVDKALRKKYYYLNYLESDVWKRVASKHGKPLRESCSRTPLETICFYNETDLIMHPVILRLIAIKWQLFGKYHTALNTGMNLIYTILWTVLGVTMPKTKIKRYYTPVAANTWRIVLEIIGLSMAFYFLVTQFLEFRNSENRSKKFKEWRNREIDRDMQYCHPRWPEERRYLTSEIKMVNTSSRSYLKNGWNIFELVTNIIMALVVFTRIIATSSSNETVDRVHYKSFPILLIMLWLRFMRSCQCYQSLGPFITMLGHVITDTMKFGFLFFEFFIPYVCAFWILFGGRPDTQFEYFNDLVYQVFLMTLVDEYERDDIMKQDKVMAQILVGTYLAIASVVCVNLYIALMSQTFTRIYQNAKATAFMQQAKHLLKIEENLGRKQKRQAKNFMNTECSPQVIYDNGKSDDDSDDGNKLMIYRMFQSVNEIKDKVLVLMVNTTNVASEKKQTYESSSTLDDITVQLDIVRKKCDKMESNLKDLHSLLNSTKEIMENKVLANDAQLASIKELKKILKLHTFKSSTDDCTGNTEPHSSTNDDRKTWGKKLSNLPENLNNPSQFQHELKCKRCVNTQHAFGGWPSLGCHRYADDTIFHSPYDSNAAFQLPIKEPFLAQRKFLLQDNESYDSYLARNFEDFLRFKKIQERNRAASQKTYYPSGDSYYHTASSLSNMPVEVSNRRQKNVFNTDDAFHTNSERNYGSQRHCIKKSNKETSDPECTEADYAGHSSNRDDRCIFNKETLDEPTNIDIKNVVKILERYEIDLPYHGKGNYESSNCQTEHKFEVAADEKTNEVLDSPDVIDNEAVPANVNLKHGCVNSSTLINFQHNVENEEDLEKKTLILEEFEKIKIIPRRDTYGRKHKVYLNQKLTGLEVRDTNV